MSVDDNTKTITVRIPAAIYTKLKKRAGQHMVSTGETCTISDVVRASIEKELETNG